MTPDQVVRVLQSHFPGADVAPYRRVVHDRAWHIFIVGLGPAAYRLWVADDAMAGLALTADQLARLRAAGQRTPPHKLLIDVQGESERPVTEM